MLSQHTSDLNAERAFADLRRAFPAGWRAIVDAPTAAVADAIRSGGLANSKAPRIQAILREVRDREGAFDLVAAARRCRTMSARDYLMSLPGIGPKTAAVVLSFALARDAMPVDTHVHRVTKRLALIPQRASAERADRILHELIPDGPANTPARGVHPARTRDLQGADAAVRAVPLAGSVSHGAPVPMRDLRAGDVDGVAWRRRR